MGLPHERYDIKELLDSVRDSKDWITEIKNLIQLTEALNELDKVTSARELAKLLHKSKSWVGVSILIAKGLKTYPEITKLRSRNEAYTFLLKKNKFRRFLES